MIDFVHIGKSKKDKKTIFFLNYLHISKKSSKFASKIEKIIIMQATLEPSVKQNLGTISMEKWENLHTIEELDASLKAIIHKHFHA